MGKKSKRLFLTFGYLTLLLVVAAFASIVASTFGTTTAAGVAVEGATLAANESTAMISFLFIALAIVFGFFVYRKNAPIGIASIFGVLGIVAIVAVGLKFHPIALTYNTWMIVIGAYILVASVTPVWILLQPRDYLSSFLLYFMIAAGIIAVIGAVVTGNGNFSVPAFGDAALKGTGVFTTGTMFPALFVTIACGAISGFHSLVSSGTTAKQLDNEKDAKPVAFGSMLIECVVAVISLCAIGFVWVSASDGTYASPTQVFAGGLSAMIGSFAGEGAQSVMYQMLILAVSVFCLTSLDTATRLARYMLQEFVLENGQSYKDAKGIGRIVGNPIVATAITVVLGVALGLTGYTKIWPLFGAANQLLAALGLIAVCTWLGQAGKNNKMFFVPMVFMLVVTIVSLVQTIIAKVKAFNATGDVWAVIQAAIAVLLVSLSLVLAHTAFKTLKAQHDAKKNKKAA
jgi:carbon starvation protein